MSLEQKATLGGVAASGFTVIGVSSGKSQENDDNSYAAVPLAKIKNFKFILQEVDAPSYKHKPTEKKHQFECSELKTCKVDVDAKTAKFPTEENQEKEITYATIDKYKIFQDAGYYTNIQGHQSSFVSSWVSEDWWEWSFKYRLKVDIDNEKSPFPRSQLFKKISEGWSWEWTSENGRKYLNILCRELYKKPGISGAEQQDMWRYCSEIGKNFNLKANNGSNKLTINKRFVQSFK